MSWKLGIDFFSVFQNLPTRPYFSKKAINHKAQTPDSCQNSASCLILPAKTPNNPHWQQTSCRPPKYSRKRALQMRLKTKLVSACRLGGIRCFLRGRHKETRIGAACCPPDVHGTNGVIFASRAHLLTAPLFFTILWIPSGNSDSKFRPTAVFALFSM